LNRFAVETRDMSLIGPRLANVKTGEELIADPIAVVAVG
jgi:hypothetical protein